MLSELGQAALEYASQGWAVFPIKPYSKKPPLLKDQYNNSTTDLEQIKTWWTDVPLANIGLDCGKSGVDVVDVDAKHEGILKVLEGLKLVSGGSKAWDTRVHQTPGGGFHYIFSRGPKEDGTLPTRSGTFGGPGIDTRSQGGYIVLPPSPLAEYGHKKYRVFRERPLIPCPRALLTQAHKIDDSADAGKTDLEALLNAAQPLKDGVRNSTLHRICSKLLRIGFAEVEARDALLSINRLRCVPPLAEADILYLVKKAYTYYKPVEDLIGDAAREEVEGDWNDQDQTVAVNIGTFLEEQKEGTTWLWEGILPTSSLNMIQGDPKSGKSTVAKHLSVAAATGRPFLGSSISQPVPVLYYSLQESKKQWKTWLLSFLTKEEVSELTIDIIWRLGKRGPNAIKGLRERILKKKYQLIVIDMIGRFLTLKDMDKYSEAEGPLSDMNDIAQETGACIVWLHHERKSGGGFEAGIGSQAIRGAVYTTIKCQRQGHGQASVFSFSTEQREGEDTEETIIRMANRQLVSAGYSAASFKQAIQGAKKSK
jgi:hypothetical protein